MRGVRMSASKIRRVLDVIRGKSYEECLIMLEFMPYRSCEPILNALFSCASNAKNNMGMNKAKLYVSECYADGGATMKRFRPRAQGRPFSIRKRTASITLKIKYRFRSRFDATRDPVIGNSVGGENDCLRHSAIVAPTADPRSPAFVFVFQ